MRWQESQSRWEVYILDYISLLIIPPELSCSYFKRPWTVDGIVNAYLQCKDKVPSELLINVDNPDEAADWVKWVYPTEGFVVPVFSYNFHESRGYNRLTALARGQVVVILQDDQLPPDDGCEWAVTLLKIFDKYPRMGAVGLNIAQIIRGEYRRQSVSGKHIFTFDCSWSFITSMVIIFMVQI